MYRATESEEGALEKFGSSGIIALLFGDFGHLEQGGDVVCYGESIVL